MPLEWLDGFNVISATSVALKIAAAKSSDIFPDIFD
jgi:hypothetical protein